MSHRKRIGAGLLCIAFILMMFISSAYLVHEAGHHCTDDDCPVCRTIAASRELLRAFGLLLVTAAVFAPSVCLQARQRRERSSAPASGTLVSWKIRLND